jgi:hypothetical protein
MFRERILEDSWASVLERTDRIISQREATVQFVEESGMSAPIAWTDGLNICLNKSRLRLASGDMARTAASLKAVNYHELCHVMFSPRTAEPFHAGMRTRGQKDELHWQAYNILEDARIENLFVSTYQPAAKFFQLMISDYIVSDTNSTTHLLTYGRKYLPAELRVSASNAWTATNDLRVRAESVIDQYLVADPIMAATPALALVDEFYEILMILRDSVHALNPPLAYGIDIGKTRAPNGKSSHSRELSRAHSVGSVRRSEFEKAKDGIKSAIDQARRADKKVKSEDVGHLKEQARKTSRETLGGSEMQRDARATTEAVKAAGKMPGTGRGMTALTSGVIPVDKHYQWAAKRITSRVKRMSVEVEPETHSRQFQGRLDLRRVMRAARSDRDVFKVWDQGHEDAVETEAVILCDKSGSMGGVMGELSQSLWALKRGLQQAGVRVTVLTFDFGSYVAYKPKDKTRTTTTDLLTAGGGTNPDSSLKATELMMSKSSKPNKLMVCLTDGSWTASSERDQIMERLKKQGVVSSLLVMDGVTNDKRGFNTVSKANSPQDLVTAVSDLVYHLQRKSLRSI